MQEEKEEEKPEPEIMGKLREANEVLSPKTYQPIDYAAALEAAEELAENAEKRRRKSFKGFVHIECEHCGQITSTCLKRWQTEFICNSCHEKTPMTDGNMRRVEVCCKCGTEISYYTNRVDGMFDIECINCGNPVTVEWNNKKKAYFSL